MATHLPTQRSHALATELEPTTPGKQTRGSACAIEETVGVNGFGEME